VRERQEWTFRGRVAKIKAWDDLGEMMKGESRVGYLLTLRDLHYSSNCRLPCWGCRTLLPHLSMLVMSFRDENHSLARFPQRTIVRARLQSLGRQHAASKHSVILADFCGKLLVQVTAVPLGGTCKLREIDLKAE